MDFLGFLFVVGALVPVWLALREMRRLGSPERLRDLAIVVRSARAFDEVSEVIGRYMGCDIYRAVIFQGTRYVFEGVATPALKRALRARHLYLEPGLVYVMG